MPEQNNPVLEADLTPILNRIPEGWVRGVFCGSGWDAILLDLDEKLAALVPNYEVNQVKEKFGGLRYYVSFPEDAPGGVVKQCRALISATESECARTCDECGQPGEPADTGTGWIRVLCPTDAEAQS